jgi:hypothetical protein
MADYRRKVIAAVAIPLIRCIKLRAVLSAVSIDEFCHYFSYYFS